ncbi:MAG: RlmE family RNA methyltransferase [Desulfobacterales bacterium]|jgi:23S rRNA (uridine2552-2'-O)-methyltransferase
MKPSATKRNRWDDHYTEQARKEKYPARSVFKLQEIQRKFHVIKKGHHVLDCGCAPGSWLLYSSQLTGSGGKVVGVDLQPVSIHVPKNAVVHTGDALSPDEDLLAAIGNGYHVVLSDMAPSTSGHKSTDAARSYALCSAALNLAVRVLVPGGSFVSKIFQGEDFQSYRDEVRTRFDKVKIFKPMSSRKASKEIFVIATGKL